MERIDDVDVPAVIYRKLVDKEALPELLAGAAVGEGRRVVVNQGGAQWDEYALSPQMINILRQPEILEDVRAAIGEIVHEASWLNVYNPEEYIDWHCDRSGDTQIIVVLKVPSSIEGQLVVRPSSGWPCIVPLYAGDAILFRASKIPHATTPIVTKGLQRVTAVTRFFHEQELKP